MDSKEFGLIAAQQLLQIQDLHYGFWGKGEIPSVDKFMEAQAKHTSYLFNFIEEAVGADKGCKILDAGCGIGITTQKLLQLGYRVDGLVPSTWMAQQARNNTQQYKDGTRGEIYECGLEDYPVASLSEKYTQVFFSESFQYVDMQKAFEVCNQILSDDGVVIIFDFFKWDDVAGKSPIGGGHSIGAFYETVKRNGYTIHSDVDVTENVSPNLKLINDVLVERVIPFSHALDAFVSTRHKLLFWVFKTMFRKRLEKIKYKYSHQRNEENFKIYKTYRLFVLSRA